MVHSSDGHAFIPAADICAQANASSYRSGGRNKLEETSWLPHLAEVSWLPTMNVGNLSCIIVAASAACLFPARPCSINQYRKPLRKQ